MSDYYEMEVNYLKLPEINYELRIRGLTNLDKIDVDTKRKALRKRLREEAARKEPMKLTVPSFNFENERAEVNQTIAEIEEKIAVFDGSKVEDSRRIRSRLLHVLGRLGRFVVGTGDGAAQIKEYQDLSIVKADALEDDRFRIMEGFEQSHVNRRNRAPVTAVQPPAISHAVPVHKWNLAFDGKLTSLSVSSFLQRVEELRVARQTSKEDLFKSAVDLFTDQALVWYRSIRNSVHSWDELTKALRRDFLPVDYDEELWSEILRRTQGPQEGVTMYVAVMQNLFGRMSETPSEEKQIRVIRRNLSPKFQSPLAVTSIDSLAELVKICRVIESSLIAQSKYQPPPRKSVALLEPDLAYYGDVPSECSSQSSSQASSRSSTKTKPAKNPTAEVAAEACYKCHKVGHYKRECPLLNRDQDPPAKRPVCSGCGTVGVIRPNCEKCRSSKSKN